MTQRISITYWSRLEPRPRGRSLRRSLAAEIRDPLWMLTRQWQLGEFQGEDAGSPHAVVVETETFGLTEWHAGSSSGTIQGNAPLEPQVLAEPYVPDLAMRVELGQMFLQFLGDDVDSTPFLQRYPLSVPSANDPLRPVEASAQRFGALMSRRCFDGFALYLDARGGGSGTVPGSPDPLIDPAAARLVAWVDATYGELSITEPERDPRSWHPERIEHRAEISALDSAGGGVTLRARPAGDGGLDWDSFELVSQTPATPNLPRTTQLLELQPTHVRFPGMPNARFWDFEEGTLSFADVDPNNRDLAKMMLVEFALVQGNDWFYFDLPQPVGSLCRVRSLVVKDVFGGQTLVQRAATTAGPRWAMFQIARSSDAAAGTDALADFLFVPPTSGILQQIARPLEEVLFARDEMANMAWAVERATPSPVGEPWPGHERDAALPRPPAPAIGPDAPPLMYQIMSRVPIHWTPFIPVRVNASANPNRPQVVLLSAEVVRTPPVPDPIRGKVLRPDGLPDTSAYVLNEEEVPRAGVQVRRFMVRSRWVDGSSHLWFARARAIGRGETGSGLRFDSALDTRGEQSS
jgi:hypothetical protein